MSNLTNLPPDPNEEPRHSNGSAPPPPDGSPSYGPLSPPAGSISTEPGREPARLPPLIKIWTPAWPRWVRRLLLVVVVAAPLLFLASWSYAEPSRNFCASCHTVEEAAAASSESIHSEVPCLSCHHRPGILGAITYYPTLIRESVHEATGIPVANGVLRAKPCQTCHETVAESEGHRNLGAECLACHADAAHPTPGEDDGIEPHPLQYTLAHGRDAASQAATCTECHQTEFCGACHVRAPYPHPDTWTSVHGTTVTESGTTSCESCHPTSFCAGCHGGEIPHPDNWFAEHNLMEFESIVPCFTCHARTECSTCHAQHSVHREQRRYNLEDSR